MPRKNNRDKSYYRARRGGNNWVFLSPKNQHSKADIKKAYQIIFNGKKISDAHEEINYFFDSMGQILKMNLDQEAEWALNILGDYIRFFKAFRKDRHHLIPTSYVRKKDPHRKTELYQRYRKSKISKLRLSHEAWHVLFNNKPAWEAIKFLESESLEKHFSEGVNFLACLVVFGNINFSDIAAMKDIINKEWSL